MTKKPGARRTASRMPRGRAGNKPRRKVPWTQVELEYLTELDTSLHALARRHKLQVQDVQRKAKAGKWAERRQEAVDAIVAETRQRAAAMIGQRAAERFSEVLDDLASVRKKVLAGFGAELDQAAGNRLVEQEQTATVTKLGEKKGESASTTVRKARLNPSAHRLAETVLRMEVEILSGAVGLSHHAERGPTESETPLRIA